MTCVISVDVRLKTLEIVSVGSKVDSVIWSDVITGSSVVILTVECNTGVGPMMFEDAVKSTVGSSLDIVGVVVPSDTD